MYELLVCFKKVNHIVQLSFLFRILKVFLLFYLSCPYADNIINVVGM